MRALRVIPVIQIEELEIEEEDGLLEPLVELPEVATEQLQAFLIDEKALTFLLVFHEE